jgi:hypothetical protein
LRARVRTTDLEADSASNAVRARRDARRDGAEAFGGEGPPDVSAEGGEVIG